MRSRTGLVALITMLLAAAAGCGSGTAGRSSAPAGPSTADPQVMTMAAAIAAPTSPRQLRAGFEQLLGLHALLAVRQMRSLVATAPAFGQVAGVAL